MAYSVVFMYNKNKRLLRLRDLALQRDKCFVPLLEESVSTFGMVSVSVLTTMVHTTTHSGQFLNVDF